MQTTQGQKIFAMHITKVNAYYSEYIILTKKQKNGQKLEQALQKRGYPNDQ